MKRILIINLKRNGDLFLNAHSVFHLKNTNPECIIEFLVIDEFLQAAQCLPGIDKIHIIERKAILSFRDNALFNWAWGLDLLHQNIESILKTDWDYVYNFSFGPFETYISSCLTKQNELGPILAENSKIKFSNNNSCYFGEVKMQLNPSGLHHFDFQKNQLPEHCQQISLSRLNVPFNEQNEEKTQNYIKKLRKKLHLNDIPCHLVGIQLSASSINKEIHLHCIDELLGLLLEDKRLFPILLLAPSESDHQKANYLNQIYNNSLLSIDCDFAGMHCVLDKLDLLITPDTSIKHLANWTQIKILEITSSQELLWSQGTIRLEGLILAPRNDSTLIPDSYLQPSAKDIYKCTLHGLKLQEKQPIKVKEDWVLYENIGTTPFIMYWPISGDFYKNDLLHIYIEKSFHYQYTHGKMTKAPYAQYLIKFAKDDLFDFINVQKTQLVFVVKNLLLMLKEIRTLKKEKGKDPSKFIEHLQYIMTPIKDKSCVNITIYILQYCMEQLPTQIFPYQLDKLEKVLYEFKNNLSILTHTLELISGIYLYQDQRQHAKI